MLIYLVLGPTTLFIFIRMQNPNSSIVYLESDKSAKFKILRYYNIIIWGVGYNASNGVYLDKKLKPKTITSILNLYNLMYNN